MAGVFSYQHSHVLDLIHHAKTQKDYSRKNLDQIRDAIKARETASQHEVSSLYVTYAEFLDLRPELRRYLENEDRRWKDFNDRAKQEAKRQSDALRGLKDYNFVRWQWGKSVMERNYFTPPDTSKKTANRMALLRTCATKWENFEDFTPFARLLPFWRHQEALYSERGGTTSMGRPAQFTFKDLKALASFARGNHPTVYGRKLDGAAPSTHAAFVASWLSDGDGSSIAERWTLLADGTVSIHSRSVKDLRSHFGYHLIEEDENGMLQQLGDTATAELLARRCAASAQDLQSNAVVVANPTRPRADVDGSDGIQLEIDRSESDSLQPPSPLISALPALSPGSSDDSGSLFEPEKRVALSNLPRGESDSPNGMFVPVSPAPSSMDSVISAAANGTRILSRSPSQVPLPSDPLTVLPMADRHASSTTSPLSSAHIAAPPQLRPAMSDWSLYNEVIDEVVSLPLPAVGSDPAPEYRGQMSATSAQPSFHASAADTTLRMSSPGQSSPGLFTSESSIQHRSSSVTTPSSLLGGTELSVPSPLGEEHFLKEHGQPLDESNVHLDMEMLLDPLGDGSALHCAARSDSDLMRNWLAVAPSMQLGHDASLPAAEDLFHHFVLMSPDDPAVALPQQHDVMDIDLHDDATKGICDLFPEASRSIKDIGIHLGILVTQTRHDDIAKVEWFRQYSSPVTIWDWPLAPRLRYSLLENFDMIESGGSHFNTMEADVRVRNLALLHSCLSQWQAEAALPNASEDCKMRAQLVADLEMAHMHISRESSTILGIAGLESDDDDRADMGCYFSDEFWNLALENKPFRKPALIKQFFSDGHLHTLDHLCANLMHGRAKEVIDVRDCNQGMLHIPVSEFVQLLRQGERAISMTESHALGVWPPSFIQLARFQLLHRAAEAAPHDLAPFVSAELKHLTTQAQISTAGAFSPPIARPFGYWIRNMSGVQLVITNPVETACATCPHVANFGACPGRRALFLEDNDVCYIPPGFYCSKVNLESGASIEGAVLDERNLLLTLKMVEFAQRNPSLAVTRLSHNLLALMAQRARLAAAEPERYSDDLSQDLCNHFYRLAAELEADSS